MSTNWQPDPLAAVADFCLNTGEIGELDLTAVPEGDVAAVWPEVAHSEWCLPPFQRYWVMLTPRRGGTRFSVRCAGANSQCRTIAPRRLKSTD